MLTDAPVQFGLIPHDHWYQPDWIDEEKATAARNEMVRNQVIYGGASVSVFRHTARARDGWTESRFTSSTASPYLAPAFLPLGSGDTYGLICRECAVPKHV